ncbi:unnamed protein product [Nesidiocoris tenuis]|uniref:Phospholipid/glycerol acyltransferase domain-containing protein n=1 Tax=Nesidiocoris tenuis TaxID=355587 RepID=A0A6H5GMA2_9HEMI|nr:unnamed protein product [Nesidiocoris tenuis]
MKKFQIPILSSKGLVLCDMMRRCVYTALRLRDTASTRRCVYAALRLRFTASTRHCVEKMSHAKTSWTSQHNRRHDKSSESFHETSVGQRSGIRTVSPLFARTSCTTFGISVLPRIMCCRAYHFFAFFPKIKVKQLICNLVRLTYQTGGMSVKTIGRQATRAEAPILVGAPHSTFLDGVVVYHTNFPCILVRKESGSNIWLGMIMNYHQPLYVRRDNSESRHKSIQDIIERATSPLDWPQILIFPEGTTTNRSCLISFKPGAFIPGLPIQPLVIRYPNKTDTVTWTWDGPGA